MTGSARQSIVRHARSGLLRRFAPRNDDGKYRSPDGAKRNPGAIPKLSVGWVERSDTHQLHFVAVMGFAGLTTVANKPGHWGEHNISRENHCVRECRVFRWTCGGHTRVPPIFAHEAAGAAGTRHSPRPQWGERFIKASGASRREGEVVCGIRGTSLRGA